MLALANNPKTPAVGNFYFSPVRLHPKLDASYIVAAHSQSQSVRSPRNSVALLDLRPRRASLEGGENNLEEFEADESDNLDEGEDGKGGEKVKEDKGEKKKTTTTTTTAAAEKSKGKEGGKKKAGFLDSDHLNSTIEHLCAKLRVSYVLAILGAIVLFACCCALFLRNRLAACCRKCCAPFRRKKKSANYDVEDGNYSSRTSRSYRKRGGNNPRMIDTGVQDSRTSVAFSPDDYSKPTGCSPCCRKKKKKTMKRRRR